MNSVRIVISGILAVVVTVGLFVFMSNLIAGTREIGDRGDQLGGIRFGPVKIDDNLQVKERRIPKKPPPPKNPPPPPKMNVQNVERVQSPMPALNMPKLDIPVSGIFQ